MLGGDRVTRGWRTECYNSPMLTVSRPGLSGPHGGPVWVAIEDQEAPERWIDDGNNFVGEQWWRELMREEKKGGRAR
jgi:hypothetical protein